MRRCAHDRKKFHGPGCYATHIKLNGAQWDLFDKYWKVTSAVAYKDKKPPPTKDQLASALIAYFLMVYEKRINEEFYERKINETKSRFQRHLESLLADPACNPVIREAINAATTAAALATVLPDPGGTRGGIDEASDEEEAEGDVRGAAWQEAGAHPPRRPRQPRLL